MKKGDSPMLARILEFMPKMEKKEEFVKVIKNEVLPILKKQNGFLDVLPLFPEIKNEKAVTISLWTEKREIEKYEREVFPKVEAILKPYLVGRIETKVYTVETALCEHFVQVLVA
jgi:quinol monooxygenase YgiN